MKLKLYEEAVIHQEGFPYTVVKKEARRILLEATYSL